MVNFWPLLEDKKNVEESNNILFLRFIHVAPQGNMKERTASGHSLSIVTLFSFSKSWPKCDSKQKIWQNCFETRKHVIQQILLLVRDAFEIMTISLIEMIPSWFGPLWPPSPINQGQTGWKLVPYLPMKLKCALQKWRGRSIRGLFFACWKVWIFVFFITMK